MWSSGCSVHLLSAKMAGRNCECVEYKFLKKYLVSVLTCMLTEVRMALFAYCLVDSVGSCYIKWVWLLHAQDEPLLLTASRSENFDNTSLLPAFNYELFKEGFSEAL